MKSHQVEINEVEFRPAPAVPVMVEEVYLNGQRMGAIWQGPKGEFQYRPYHRSVLGPYSGLPYHSLDGLHQYLIEKARK